MVRVVLHIFFSSSGGLRSDGKRQRELGDDDRGRTFWGGLRVENWCFDSDPRLCLRPEVGCSGDDEGLLLISTNDQVEVRYLRPEEASLANDVNCIIVSKSSKVNRHLI